MGLTGVGLLVWRRAGGWQPLLCCEATVGHMPWIRGEVVALFYTAAGVAMFVLLVAAVRRERILFRSQQANPATPA